MSLYPTTLFHFTTKEHFYDILAGAFRVSYARERVMGPGSVANFGVPMVSFCDLRLSEVKMIIGEPSETGKYGSFGIGMTKAWAQSKGLNPVWYVSRESHLTAGLVEGMKGLHKHLKSVEEKGEGEELRVSFKNLRNLYRYIKNYVGDLERKGYRNKDYLFANEREWRYVPPPNREAPEFALSKDMDSDEKKIELNKTVADILVDYTVDDIAYLIVAADGDIEVLVDVLSKNKKGFSAEQINRLTSRILTSEQIRNDV